MIVHKSIPIFAAFLFVAIILYAFFSSPTPDNPGLIEAAIGGLLMLSVVTASIKNGLSIFIGRNFYLKSLQVFFLCGLILPTIVGIYYNNDHGLILRDFLAFMFLGLPLFLSERLAINDRASKIFATILVMAGIVFCVRTLLPVFNIWIPEGELLYLSNSPLALFAAVFLICALWIKIQTPTKQSLAQVAIMLVYLGILLAAMILDVQRATIGAVLISLIVMIFATLVQSPRKIILPFVLMLALGLACFSYVDDALQAMLRKTADVGLNMRSQEAMAVFDTIRANPLTFFVGQGWGSVFTSPAVGGLEVNYTHSFLTTMALKGGAILFLPAMLMVLGALHEIFLIFQRDKGRGLSLLWPLIIPVFLYASHKSLDFGLILLLIGVWSIQRAGVAQRPSLV